MYFILRGHKTKQLSTLASATRLINIPLFSSHRLLQGDTIEGAKLLKYIVCA